MKTQPGASNAKHLQGRELALAFFVLALPLLLGGWNINMNKGINPSYVGRIEDGKTKKSEILTLFGDPQETKRTPEGIIYIYKTLRPKETPQSMKKKGADATIAPSVDSPFTLEETLKRKPKEGPVQEVGSILTIYFGADGETVMSHEFKQY